MTDVVLPCRSSPAEWTRRFTFVVQTNAAEREFPSTIVRTTGQYPELLVNGFSKRVFITNDRLMHAGFSFRFEFYHPQTGLDLNRRVSTGFRNSIFPKYAAATKCPGNVDSYRSRARTCSINKRKLFTDDTRHSGIRFIKTS